MPVAVVANHIVLTYCAHLAGFALEVFFDSGQEKNCATKKATP